MLSIPLLASLPTDETARKIRLSAYIVHLVPMISVFASISCE
jgi:hypothetical protein